MSAPATTPIPAWEHRIDEHTFHLMQAARTKDLTIVNGHAAGKPISSVNDRAILRTALGEAEPPVDVVLDNLNVESCDSNETAITGYKTAIDTERNGLHSREEWEQFMEEEKTKAITTVTTKIRSTTEIAKGIIRALPEAAQVAASNLFLSGNRIVLGVFNTLVQQLNELYSKINQFLEGIFTAVTTAYDIVTNSVNEAVKFIKGIFQATDDSINAPGAMASRPSGDVPYVGTCHWPATSSVTEVTLNLCAIITQILRFHPKVTVHYTMIEVQRGYISTVVNFETGLDATTTDVTSLDSTWKRAINDWVKTGPKLTQPLTTATSKNH